MHNVITQEKLLLSTLRGKYASQFAKRFGEMEPHIIDMIIKGALVGINEDQFNQGMARLLAPGNKFMPDIAEFQSWCVSGSWWTTDKAWLAACRLTTLKKIKTVKDGDVEVCKDITHEAKLALDQVVHLITDCRMKEAERLFKSVYEELIAKAQQQGRHQSWYVPPVMIATSKAVVARPKYAIPEQSAEDKALIESKTKEFMAQGMGFASAMFAAMKELGAVKGSVA